TLVVKSKYSKLLNRAENPTETLDYSYEQMLQQLQNVKRGTADVVTSKKRLELQQQKLEQNVVKLETQARQAVAANREDLAMQARAAAIDELTSTGALEDFSAGDQTQLDRELAQISSASQVDDELAKIKAEVGSGESQKEIAAGDAEPAPGATGAQPAAGAEPAAQPAEETTES